MAVSIPSVGTTAETATNVSTPTTLSPGLPATRAVGDILLCLTVCRSSTPTVSVSTAGWAELANVAATNARIALYACKVTGSEAAAQPVWAGLTTGTSGTGASAQIACVRGLDITLALTALVHKLSAAQNQTASSTAQAMGATITPTLPNSAVFSLALRQDNDVTDANWPVIGTAENITWAKVAAVLNSASGADHAQSFQWGQQGAAAAIAAKTVTVSGGSSDASSAILVSLLTAIFKAIAAAAETDAAQALTFTQAAQSKTLTPATETGAAQALSYGVVAGDQHKDLAGAAETDSAAPLSFTQAAQTVTLNPAGGTDAAAALSGAPSSPQTKTINPAAETDSAGTLSTSQAAQSANIAAAGETGTSAGLAVTQSAQGASITTAAGTDMAQPLTFTQQPISVTLTPAGETDTALTVSTGNATHVTLNAAVETDAAQPLSITQQPAQSTSTSPTAETSSAVALTVTQQPPVTVTIGAATETDTAAALSVAGGIFVTIAPAVETSDAVHLSHTGGASVTYPVGTTGHLTRTWAGALEEPKTGRLDG